MGAGGRPEKRRKTMKKRILSALLAGSMALGLAACGSSSTGSTTAAAPAETKAAESAAAGDAAASTTAGDWQPTGPISLVLPAGAGGDTDLSARIFAQYAKEATGVDFVVVNASGASGSVAANQVLSAANDGQTGIKVITS